MAEAGWTRLLQKLWSTFDSVFPDQAGVFSDEIFAWALATGSVIGALEGIVAELLAMGALGNVVELDLAF
jgi:hypothetical protein